MVPVTTKPFLNRVPLMNLQQGVPAFFLFSKAKSKNILIPATAGKKEDFYHGTGSGIRE